MTREMAHIEIKEIIEMSLLECQRKYFVDTKEEIIALIEDEVELEDDEQEGDIYNENGFSTAFHCNSYLY